MTKYIGQITVILETATPDLASESLSFLARQLDDIRPEVVFADHNGEVEDYEEIERECEESLTTAPAMTANDRILTDIARQHLGLSTLDTRRSDSLDFHNVAIWSVAEALKAAFNAGAAASRVTSTALSPTSTGLPLRFDDYEVHGVYEFSDDGRTFCEQVPDDEAQFWSLFGHIPGQGAECIGDFKTRGHAEEIYARITGRLYGSRS
jgi:hypothetical protein